MLATRVSASLLWALLLLRCVLSRAEEEEEELIVGELTTASFDKVLRTMQVIRTIRNGRLEAYGNGAAL